MSLMSEYETAGPFLVGKMKGGGGGYSALRIDYNY